MLDEIWNIISQIFELEKKKYNNNKEKKKKDFLIEIPSQ